MDNHKLPEFKATAFYCPFCGAYAKQHWSAMSRFEQTKSGPRLLGEVRNTFIALCDHCGSHSFWIGAKMIYPFSGTAPLPNPDLPDDIKDDFNEARNIVELSPRGSAALLRLSIQKLCVFLGEKGVNINTDIGNLVKKGLPVKMQQALDSVRVIGNNAVHPGVIDLKDDIETTRKLFAFVNIIADVMITQPKEIEKFYNEKVPDEQKKAIDKRDTSI
jgi:hypothetical protein